MKGFQLKNKANKTKGTEDILQYKDQRNYVVNLNNQSKQEHCDSLNPFPDSKPFWKGLHRSFPKNIPLVIQNCLEKIW